MLCPINKLVLSDQRLPGIGPFERVRVGLVVPLDVMHDLLYQFHFGAPDRAPQHISRKDAEPDFDLVEP